MGRENTDYCRQWYWALGGNESGGYDMHFVKNMTAGQACIIRALRRDNWTWRGIMSVARDEFCWPVDETQMAGEQLCMLAAEILGHKDTDFEDEGSLEVSNKQVEVDKQD